MGELQPISGTISRHPALKLGKFFEAVPGAQLNDLSSCLQGKYSQHSADQLDFELSPLEYFEKHLKEKLGGKDVQ